MEQIVRKLDVQERGAVAAVQDLLWQLMDQDAVQALLVPLQAHPHEAPAPTLIKNRERLDKANPLAPVMTLNSAKIVGLLLAQESGKRLAAVMRPCEARSLVELAKQQKVDLTDLVMVSIDCLGSHVEEDYEQRATLWGDDVPTRESLRWSRQGQIAPYRFRQACQMCEQPFFDQANISIGLFGQDVNDSILVFMDPGVVQFIGLNDDARMRPALERNLGERRKTIDRLTRQRHATRQRFLRDIQNKAAELTDLLAMFGSCTLCGECQGACPLTDLSGFDIDHYEANTAEYLTARLLDITRRSESCVGCGMCEAACQVGIPLMLVTQMVAERVQFRQEIIAMLTQSAARPY